MTAFYNELDRYPAQWLRNLIDAGHIAPGVVDERSIVDLDPEELRGYTQAHFFAGIGVWSHALRLAGWADSDGVWTGSCPCQPFSAAGKRGGHADERHLWPAWFRLIRECRPRVVFGEQVASKDGLAWLDAVRADMEGEGYAFGAVDLCAAGAGAPHIRQRAFFVAYAPDAYGRPGERRAEAGTRAHGERRRRPTGDGAVDGVAYAEPVGEREPRREGEQALRSRHDADGRGPAGDVEHAAGDGRRERRPESGGRRAAARREYGLVADARDEGLEGHAGHERNGNEPGRLGADQAGPVAAAGASGFWSDAAWVWCRDNVWRPHGPESFPLTLANGTPKGMGRDGAGEDARFQVLVDEHQRPIGQAPSRVGMLRAYGNAIVAPLAAEFVRAFMDTHTPPSRGGKE